MAPYCSQNKVQTTVATKAMSRPIPATFSTLLRLLPIAPTFQNMHIHTNTVPCSWLVLPIPLLPLLEKPSIPQDAAPMSITCDTCLISPNTRSFTISVPWCYYIPQLQPPLDHRFFHVPRPLLLDGEVPKGYMGPYWVPLWISSTPSLGYNKVLVSLFVSWVWK